MKEPCQIKNDPGIANTRFALLFYGSYILLLLGELNEDN